MCCDCGGRSLSTAVLRVLPSFRAVAVLGSQGRTWYVSFIRVLRCPRCRGATTLSSLFSGASRGHSCFDHWRLPRVPGGARLRVSRSSELVQHSRILVDFHEYVFIVWLFCTLPQSMVSPSCAKLFHRCSVGYRHWWASLRDPCDIGIECQVYPGYSRVSSAGYTGVLLYQ